MKRLYEFSKATKAVPVKKGWILPDGMFEPITQGFTYAHSGWIASRPDWVKRLKIPANWIKNLEKYDTEIRKLALKGGMVRVNYVLNGGHVVFELLGRYLKGQIMDAILEIVQTNAPEIDNIEMHLFDDRWMYRTKSVPVFRYDNDEKVEHIPFVTESLRTGV